jgi:hypothetical protein
MTVAPKPDSRGPCVEIIPHRSSSAQPRFQVPQQGPSLIQGALVNPNWTPLSHPPTGRYFSPALPSDCLAIDLPKRASSPGEDLPICYTSLRGIGPDCPLLRASSDHCFIVGALRTRRAPGRSLPILLRPRVARAQRIGSSRPHFLDSPLLSPIPLPGPQDDRCHTHIQG